MAHLASIQSQSIASPITLPRNKQHRVKLPDDAMYLLRRKLDLTTDELKDVADTIGKSLSCLYAIRSGRTKWPRGSTLFDLLNYFDMEMYIPEKSDDL